MKYKTRTNILTISAYKYLPYAEKEMKALERKREIVGAAFLKKRLTINGVIILLHAMIGFNKIIMWGGGFGQMIISGAKGSFVYNYLENSMVKFNKVLEEIFQVDHNALLQTSKLLRIEKVKVLSKITKPFGFSIMVPKGKTGVTVSSTNIEKYIGEDGFAPLAQLPPLGIVDDKGIANGPFAGIFKSKQMVVGII